MLRRKSGHAAAMLCAAATLTVITVIAIRTDVAQAESSATKVTIAVDGSERSVRTAQATVGATLREAGVEIGPADLVYPILQEQPREGMRIRVVRVVDKVVLEERPIAFKTRRQATTDLRAGLTKVATEGANGLKHVYFRERYEDGKQVERKLIRADVVTKPTDKVILIGERGAWASRGAFTTRTVLTMRASAYDPGPRSCGRWATGRTCTGMRAGYGVVAVDPRVIPLGSKLYVEGYGFAIAGDRGRAIKGNRIDLGYDTYSAAKKFGRKQVKVHLLEE